MAQNGTANKGGGGGGSGSTDDGGAGGSGLVVVRWTTTDGSISATRTGITDGGVQTSGSDSYLVITAGSGVLQWFQP